MGERERGRVVRWEKGEGGTERIESARLPSIGKGEVARRVEGEARLGDPGLGYFPSPFAIRHPRRRRRLLSSTNTAVTITTPALPQIQ